MESSPTDPYFIGSYTCPFCGAVSHNPNDALFRYCGRCHEWGDEPLPLRVAPLAGTSQPPGASLLAG